MAAARAPGSSGPGVIREAAVGGRAMAARGSRRRALRLLLMVQLLAGRWRPAGAARVARGGEPGRGCGPRGSARFSFLLGIRGEVRGYHPTLFIQMQRKGQFWRSVALTVGAAGVRCIRVQLS